MRLAILLAAGLSLGACQSSPGDVAAAETAAAGGAAAGPTVIDVATAESLVDDVSQLGAETVVLNFWATWCGPCRAEFPVFVAYDRAHADEGTVVRFVSVDDAAQREAVADFLAEHDVDDPSYLYTGTGDLTSQLNPFVGGAVPITMVLDGEGIVLDTHVGSMSEDALNEFVATARSQS